MRSPSERVMKNEAHPGDAFVPMSSQEKSPDSERHLFVARLESAIELAARPALQTPAHDLQSHPLSPSMGTRHIDRWGLQSPQQDS